VSEARRAGRGPDDIWPPFTTRVLGAYFSESPRITARRAGDIAAEILRDARCLECEINPIIYGEDFIENLPDGTHRHYLRSDLDPIPFTVTEQAKAAFGRTSVGSFPRSQVYPRT
jgi:hypothetical protein